MPREIRRLVFTYQEATIAITEYGKKYNISFPKGRIIHAKFASVSEYELHNMKEFKSPIHRTYNVKEKRSAVIITFFDEDTLEHKYFNLTADFISAALIEYSLNNKIMLPKNASKEMDVTEFNICLDINYENYLTPENKPLSLDD